MAKAKKIVRLDCDGDAAHGITLVLTSRLAEMVKYRAAALDAGDIEGVHDMRVASRRLRSALRDFLPYMSKGQLSDTREELRKVADALGRARDHDVAAVALKEVASEAPAEAHAVIEEFASARRVEAEQEREALAGEISKERLARLQAEFVEALERALAAARRRKKAGQRPQDLSFRDVGREVILARWEELRKISASLYRPFKAKRLHKARISAKRLRYALELFAPCLGDRLKTLAKEVARLQKSLGELHDCDDWIKTFGARLREQVEGEAGRKSSSRGKAGRQRAATVWLMDHFVEQRTKHYREALARWCKWEAGGFEGRLSGSLETAQVSKSRRPRLRSS